MPSKPLPTPTRGDVFKAVLDPTKGSEQGGVRPVVVVSRDAINASSPVVIVIPITDLDHKQRLYPSHVALRQGSGGLTKDSVALAEQIRAIEKSRFTEHWGKLGPVEMEQVDAAIKKALALK